VNMGESKISSRNENIPGTKNKNIDSDGFDQPFKVA
jgi:hypothetical protein